MNTPREQSHQPIWGLSALILETINIYKLRVRRESSPACCRRPLLNSSKSTDIPKKDNCDAAHTQRTMRGRRLGVYDNCHTTMLHPSSWIGPQLDWLGKTPVELYPLSFSLFFSKLELSYGSTGEKATRDSWWSMCYICANSSFADLGIVFPEYSVPRYEQ